jgi:hypothetical protein
MLALGGTLALLAGLTACTSDEPAAAPVRTTAEQIWTTAGLEPVSAVRNVGGVAVVYGTTPGGLVIYGDDAHRSSPELLIESTHLVAVSTLAGGGA